MSPSPSAFEQPGASCVHFTAGLDAEPTAAIDGSAVHGRDSLMDALKDALELPGYFGGNWDALDEVLRDPGALGTGEQHLLVVRDAERVWREHPRLAGKLVEAWLFAAPSWIDRGVPFHLVFEW